MGKVGIERVFEREKAMRLCQEGNHASYAQRRTDSAGARRIADDPLV